MTSVAFDGAQLGPACAVFVGTVLDQVVKRHHVGDVALVHGQRLGQLPLVTGSKVSTYSAFTSKAPNAASFVTVSSM